jgi:hypothetical protein
MIDTGFVYKWSDSSNGMWYIGSHKGTPDDGYIGSGTRFTNAYNARPVSFTREIIYEGEHYRELEELILKELDAANDKKSYNLKNEAIGFGVGTDNPKYGRNKGKDNPNYGNKLSDEAKKKLSIVASKRTGEKNPFYGKTHSKETKERLKRNNNRAVYSEVLDIRFESVADAARYLNINLNTLYSICYHNRKNEFGVRYI